MATKKGTKTTTQKKVKTTTTSTTQKKQKLFEFNGKFYAVGAILTIGSDPFYIDTSKKNTNRLIKKNKAVSRAQSRLLYQIGYKHENDEDDEKEKSEDEVSSEDEANEDSVDQDDENSDDEEKPIKVRKLTVADVDKMTKASLTDELLKYGIVKKSANLSDLKGSLKSIIQKKVKKIVTNDIDYKLKEVDLLTGPMLDMAITLGLDKRDLKITKLEPFAIQYNQLNNIEVQYKHFDQFVVVEDKNGDLKLEDYNPNKCREPISEDEYEQTIFSDGYVNCNKKLQTKILDLDVFPPPVPNKYNPVRTDLPPPAHYTGTLKVGNYVKFISYTGKPREIEGIITGFNQSGFIVKDVKSSYKWVVAYDDMTIKHVNIGYGNHYKLGARINEVVLSEFLNEQLCESTRRHTSNLLFETIAEFLTDIYEDPKTTNEINTNGSRKRDINWELISQPLKTWDGYYAEQFRNWMYKKLYPIFYTKAPEFNVTQLIDKLVDTFGEDLFDDDGEFMLNKLNSSTNDDPFFVYVKSKLYNYGYTNLRTIRYSALATLVSSIIDGYLIHRSWSEVENSIRDEWISREFMDYMPTDDDRLEFDQEFLTALRSLFADYENAWKLSWKKAKTSSKNKGTINETIVNSITFKGRLLSTKGKTLLENVGILEVNIYKLSIIHGQLYGNSTGLNFDYLRNVVELLMYLDPIDNVGKYSKYLRSKIIAGLFDVQTLCDLTNIEKFPEFFINTSLTEDQTEIGKKQLEYEVYNKMVSFINLWFFDVNQRMSEQKFPWKKYTQPVALNCNAVRVRKDLEFRGIEHNSENYDCHEIGENTYSCLAKVESIPDEDIVISHDKQTNKFVCNSLNDIFYALKDQDNNKEAINYITGKPYDIEFLETMRLRYGDLLQTLELPERSVMSFTSDRENLEFYWLFTEYYDKKPRLPIKRTKQQIKEEKTVIVKSQSKKQSLTLGKALDDTKAGQTLVIIFKPSAIPISTFKDSYAGLVKENKLKVVVIETDDSNYDSMLNDLRKKKIVEKLEVPIWIIVPTAENSLPSIVYNKEIKKQNITIKKKFKDSLTAALKNA